jgi:hypothetical protein
VRPRSWTGSRGGFDPLPGVVILELRRAQVAECGVQSACVVDLVNEAGKARGDLLERFVVHEVDGISLNAAAPGKRNFLVFGIAPLEILGQVAGAIGALEQMFGAKQQVLGTR